MNYDAIVGVDISSNSTGLCMYNLKNKKYSYGALCNHYNFSVVEDFNIKEHNLIKPLIDEIDEIKIYKRLPQSRPKGNNFHSYARKHLNDCLALSIEFEDFFKHFVRYIYSNNILVCIEEMPSQMRSSNVRELTEFNLAVKLALQRILGTDDIYWFYPQIVKKKLTGNGNAKKTEMLKKYISLPRLDNFHSTIKKNYKLYMTSKDVKSPVQDIIDAFSLVELGREMLEQ